MSIYALCSFPLSEVGKCAGATADAATEIYVPITSDGTHPVVLSFVPSSPGGVVPLNAFFIIPEPGTMTLLAAAAACLAGFAWRRRRAVA